jgi:CHAT domain-containing protein
MKKLSILTFSILSLTCCFPTEKTLAISSNQSVNKSQLTDSSSLEEQAQKLYEDGKFTSAVTVLQNAIKNYSNQGDILGEVIAWRNLALVFQKMGDATQAEQAIKTSLEQIKKIKNGKESQQLLAETLEVKGQLQLSIGNSQAALETWKTATNIYQKIGENTGFIRSKINQSQALQALGLYSQAVKNLEESQQILNQQQDNLIKAKALLSLGDVLRGIGQLDKSQEVLEQSLAIAQKLSSSTATIQALVSLGKTTAAQGNNTQKALTYFQEVIEKSPTSDLRIQGQLNKLELLVDNKQLSDAQQIIPQIQTELTQLPLTRTAVYSRISLAQILLKLPPESYSQSWLSHELATAIKLSQKLADKRGESYATGTLGNLYEQNKRYQEAKELTEKALLISQSNNAPELSYQWQWQLGRIITTKPRITKADRDSAIAAYTQSVKTLKSIRTDIVAISSEAQFDFRERVEPVYREFAELLLAENPSQEQLKQAREVIESLQLAELDNFFRNACLDAKPVQIDQIDRTSAIFYTIVLKHRLEVIVALPDQTLYHHTEKLSESEIENTIEELRAKLARKGEIVFQKKMLSVSQKVYNWLIKPMEDKLQANKVKNLVFISDGILRNIPMSVLHDGKEYLIEKYSIANAPSLQLIDPKALAREQIQLLGGGLSESRFNYPPLPNVVTELERIKAEVPNSLLLTNDAFTDQQLEKKVNQNPYQVVHLATHGEFSSKAEDTFVLTWNQKLGVDDLNVLLRADKKQIRPIELLVLSACKTAAGDKRATLGLAGMAVRAGARSTLASLWYVDDEATALLMTKFYQELSNNSLTKAQILRNAQLAILRDKSQPFSHPYYWSAFVLVGNWL